MSKISQNKPLPDHVVALADQQWVMWRCVRLRGAGFPAALVSELATPSCASRADQILYLETELVQAGETATRALECQRHWGLKHVERHAILVLKRQKVNLLTTSLVFPHVLLEVYPELKEVVRLTAQLRATWLDYIHHFEATRLNTSYKIRSLIENERFREALTWQNRQIVHTCLASLQRHEPTEPGGQARRRKEEALVARYLQRYCMKNDTIGFFGPVGWARLVEQGPPLRLEPGPHLLEQRQVFFESWGIETLAQRLAQNRALRPWLVPRRMPYLSVDGFMLLLPTGHQLRLVNEQALVLSACEGKETAQELAYRLIAQPQTGFQRVEEVYAVLELLQTTRRITWSLVILPDGEKPENQLRKQLERIEDIPLRRQCVEALDQLERARQFVEQAAGNAQQVDAAIEHLETIFTRLTGSQPTRLAGQTYVGRTLIYEDCRRDLMMEVGPDLWLTLSEPLSLLLQSARWFSFHLSRLYRRAFEQIYEQLVQRYGSSCLDFASFSLQLQPLLFNEQHALVQYLVPALQEHWMRLLALPEGIRRVHYTSQQLRPKVLTSFAAPQPGWQSARYHSPDILIEASSVEAIQAGEYQFVLGELHPATNSFQTAVSLSQHPAPEQLLHNVTVDLPEPRLFPLVAPQAYPGTRTHPALITQKDIALLYTSNHYQAPSAHCLPISSLVLERVGGKLLIRTRDGHSEFDPIEVIAEFLSRSIVHRFAFLPERRYTPRISIDRLVFKRETWRFLASELHFAWAKTEGERFIAARRWKQNHDLPRFIFVKVPDEPKPCYVDLASALYIEVLTKLIRGHQGPAAQEQERWITVSEMLPGPEQLWLCDSQGQSYTCELRLVALDLEQPGLQGTMH